MNRTALGIAAAGKAALSGCSTATPQSETATQLPDRVPAEQAGLVGSTWRLVEFQSMDDAQGTMRPADPANYTMQLLPEGRVAFRLDCNRGNGSWQHDPSQDGVSGSISFSQLAVTKALCPEPSMGEKLERDTQYMRGYLVRDGKLNISLKADGGIYVWEPVP